MEVIAGDTTIVLIMAWFMKQHQNVRFLFSRVWICKYIEGTSRPYY